LLFRFVNVVSDHIALPLFLSSSLPLFLSCIPSPHPLPPIILNHQDGNRVPSVVVDCLHSLPPLAPNRYGVLSGVDRMKILKKVRDVIDAQNVAAERAAAELAKSPLRPPRALEPVPLYSRFGRGQNGNDDDDDDDYDIEPDSETEEENIRSSANNQTSDAEREGKTESKKDTAVSASAASPGLFTIDIHSIQVPSVLTPGKGGSAGNTGRSSRVEHDSDGKKKRGGQHSPKPADENTDSDSDDELTPRTIAKMQAAYGEMMGGGGGGGQNQEEERAEEKSSSSSSSSSSTSSSTTTPRKGRSNGGTSSGRGESSPKTDDEDDSKIIHLVGGASTRPTVLGGQRGATAKRRSRVLEHSDEEEDDGGMSYVVEGETKSGAPSAASTVVPPPAGPRPKNNGGRSKYKSREVLEKERDEREAEETRQKAVYDSMMQYKAEKAARAAAAAARK